MAPVSTVRIPAQGKKDIDAYGRVQNKLIDLCRVGAAKDNVRVIIERVKPSGQRIPVLEISPNGDVAEIGPPTLKASLADKFPAALRQIGFAHRNQEAAANKAANKKKGGGR